MAIDLRDERLNNPEVLTRLFESLGYHNLRNHNNYLSFGRSEDSSPKSLVVYYNQDKAFVKDYARGTSGDLIRYIHEAHNLSFYETAKLLENAAQCKLDDYVEPLSNLFGGFFKNRRRRRKQVSARLDPSCLLEYESIPNIRFLRDHISLAAQDYFEIGYDKSKNLITIPVYSPEGDLIGVKGRVNREPRKGEAKYHYLKPCMQSSTLYGYFHNKPALKNNTIFIFEAEKSVMQAFTYGYRNTLAIGSNTLSDRQINLIAALHPTKVVLMLDEGLNRNITKHNLESLQSNIFLKDVPMYYWQAQNVPEKASPCDMGKKAFESFIETQLVEYKEEMLSEK